LDHLGWIWRRRRFYPREDLPIKGAIGKVADGEKKKRDVRERSTSAGRGSRTGTGKKGKCEKQGRYGRFGVLKGNRTEDQKEQGMFAADDGKIRTPSPGGTLRGRRRKQAEGFQDIGKKQLRSSAMGNKQGEKGAKIHGKDD